MSADVDNDEQDGDQPRPWEQPGAARRDCAPHRGVMLQRLATAAVWLGFLSLFTGVTALPAALLGTVAYELATGDLDRMDAGLMDPGGRGAVGDARAQAALGLLFALAGVPTLLVLTLFLVIPAFR